MANRTYGFGIIGAGMISHIHAKAINDIPHARIAGVFNINPAKADTFASQYHCKAHHQLEDMLTDPAIDIVCICTPSGAHLEPALKSIAAGKHCLIEKPLEVTLEKCDAIINAAASAGVKIGVIFPSRFYAASMQLKKAVDENRFGNLVLGDAYVKWYRSAAYYKSAAWRGTWQLDGGGALMNQGIHSVDLLQWYMGPVASVQAFTANRQHKGIEVEDTVVAVLKFANGALGNIEASTAIFPGSLKKIELMGTTGSAIMEESTLIKWEFEQKTASDQELLNQLSKPKSTSGGAANPGDLSTLGHQYQIEDMINAVENDMEPMINGQEGRKSVEIVLAIYESAKTGKMVTLPLNKT
jgi:UDP-N-acetyl-2-amino-2-deoxyglucuronate dehydrogenase